MSFVHHVMVPVKAKEIVERSEKSRRVERQISDLGEKAAVNTSAVGDSAACAWSVPGARV